MSSGLANDFDLAAHSVLAKIFFRTSFNKLPMLV